MKKLYPLVCYVVVLLSHCTSHSQEKNYRSYHEEVIQIETLISERAFHDALLRYDTLFLDYEFVFLKDFKIATQLALMSDRKEKAYQYLEKGIQNGWTKKDIRKNEVLKELRSGESWRSIKKNYKHLRQTYEQHLNSKIRDDIKSMFSKDQWRALKAALKFGEKSQERYLRKKFIPHSEKQLKRMLEIVFEYGYPGEQLIGNDYWASTIISHHNSILTEYTKQDTLYPQLKPLLYKAYEKGQISPMELASIDEWHLITKNESDKAYYGILEQPSEDQKAAVNSKRRSVGLRPLEVRDELIKIQDNTGMNFYLNGDPW